MELEKIVDPILLFKEWLSEAEKKEIRDPNAMQLATVSKNGMPSVRTVLLKDIINGDFVFYTNYESRKSEEINETAKGAICFYWKSLNRQVRLVGSIQKVSDEISDEYYQSRSKGSRIGAWASKQSKELESREILMEEVKLFEAKYNDDVPRPSFGVVLIALFTYLCASSKECLISIDLANEADKAEAIVQPVPWV